MNWISVKERLPTNNNPVLILVKPNNKYINYFEANIFVAKYCYCSGFKEVVSNMYLGNPHGKENMYFDWFHLTDITHWQPLPEEK